MGAGSEAATPKTPGYHSPADLDLLRKDKSLQIYEGPGMTAVEHRIHSDFSLYVWKVVESWFEDGTSIEVEGSQGVLFSIEESGPYWGYHDGEDSLDIFAVDSSGVAFSQGDEVKNFSQINYEYVAILVTKKAMTSYDCSFNIARLRDKEAVALAHAEYRGAKNENDYQIILEITKFLSENGTDLAMDRCKQNPKYLKDAARSYSEGDQ